MKAKSGSGVKVDPAQLAALLGRVPLGADELASLRDSLGRRFANALRVRRDLPLDSIPFDLDPVAWYALGYHLRDSDQRPSLSLSYASGDYYLQDAGSLLAVAAIQADEAKPACQDQLVCDLCAAPGGKATAVLESLSEGGFLLANEPIRSRVPALLYNLARTGSNRFVISQQDPESLADQLAGCFDVVLVDAPCSGQALFAKNRQSTAAFSEKQIQHSAARQQRILAAATRLLRAGGRLVYSTCTFAEAENESQVHWLINCFGLQPAPLDRLARYASPSAPASYRLWPHRHACAGSFAASLQTDKADSSNASFRTPRPVKPEAELQQWFAIANDRLRFFSGEANLYAIPADAPAWAESVAILGPEVAHRTGKIWKPAHAAARLRTTELQCLNRVDVGTEAAEHYLTGAPVQTSETGWSVVYSAGRPLGWIKGDGRIGKNHLPVAARFAKRVV